VGCGAGASARVRRGAVALALAGAPRKRGAPGALGRIASQELLAMVLTPSTMMPLGTPAPGFELPDHDQRQDRPSGRPRREAGAGRDLPVQPLSRT
jgi:hypothetical protein